MSEINHFDFVFVVDTTGSMGTFIDAARKLMITMVKSLAENANVDMKIGIVEYRDHRPQDQVLTIVHQLTDVEKARSEIAKLALGGGGDMPEAVFDGIMDACKKIHWRKHSRKVAILVGDAPPHGVGALGDGFPKGCPCGETIESVGATAEQKGVTLYAISLNPAAKKSFGQLAQLTGGEVFDSHGGNDAVDKIQRILNAEFGNLALDAKVLEAWNDDVTIDGVADKLSAKVVDVSSSYMRLCSRGLIEHKMPVQPELVEV